jgi:ER membrane protein complex subunit 3
MSSPIPFHYYQAISQDLSKAFAEGTYLKDGPPRQGETPAPPNPLSDPAAMDGMMAGMRTQMVMMVPQMIVMGWINFFFEGFVLSTFCPPRFDSGPVETDDGFGESPVKLPFPLTLGFKSMLQRGIQTPDMDVRWVSSLSWYFLNFFGLNGLYRIILGGDEGGSSYSFSCFYSVPLCLIWVSRGRCYAVARREPFRNGYASGRAASRL